MCHKKHHKWWDFTHSHRSIPSQNESVDLRTLLPAREQINNFRMSRKLAELQLVKHDLLSFFFPLAYNNYYIIIECLYSFLIDLDMQNKYW